MREVGRLLLLEQEQENPRELPDRLQKGHDASADLRKCKASLEQE